jgi:hypothetical protein
LFFGLRQEFGGKRTPKLFGVLPQHCFKNPPREPRTKPVRSPSAPPSPEHAGALTGVAVSERASARPRFTDRPRLNPAEWKPLASPRRAPAQTLSALVLVQRAEEHQKRDQTCATVSLGKQALTLGIVGRSHSRLLRRGAGAVQRSVGAGDRFGGSNSARGLCVGREGAGGGEWDRAGTPRAQKAGSTCASIHTQSPQSLQARCQTAHPPGSEPRKIVDPVQH